MIPKLTIAVYFILALIAPQALTAEYVEDLHVIPTSIPELVDFYADKHGVSRSLAHHIVKRESSYNPNALGDMNLTCKRTGLPVRARGLMQITECFHPHVTDEQAFDPHFNLDYGMQLVKKNCMMYYSTCRSYK